MPDVHLDQSIMSLFEQAAPFDEFQNFGLDPYEQADFDDIPDFDFED